MFFTVNSTGRMAPAFLTLVISIYLLSLSRKTLRTYLLAGYFFTVSVFHFGHLFAYSMLDPVGRWGWYLVATGIFSAVFKIRFVYHIPRNSFPREERLVFWVSVALVGAAWIEYLIRAGLSSVFYPENQTFGSPFVSTSLPIVLFIILIWSIVVLLRQFIRREGDYQAAMVFLGLTLIELGLTIFLILQRAELLAAGPDTTEMLMNFSLVVLYFLYALFYLNLSSEPSSFIAKTGRHQFDHSRDDSIRPGSVAGQRRRRGLRQIAKRRYFPDPHAALSGPADRRTGERPRRSESGRGSVHRPTANERRLQASVRPRKESELFAGAGYSDDRTPPLPTAG